MNRATEDKYHDQEKDDPNLVDSILSRELMKLSVQERTKIQEEVHGVGCLAPEETPDLIRKSLDRLQWELDNIIPSHQKQAYLQSQQLDHEKYRNSHTSYVNTDEFRLRFLRCDLFDVGKAAIRMTKFLDLILELYGKYALRRPIQLSDFSSNELMHIRKGRYQFLPNRDRGGISGRRVLCIFPDREWENIPPYLRNKIMIYFTWVAGNDVDVQREGIVFVVWWDSSFQASPSPPVKTKDHETLTIRACAIHVCTPDTPFYRLRRSIMTMRIGRHNRGRYVVHLGTSVELRYKIQAYGVHSDQIPLTYTGTIKTNHVRQWIEARKFIESNHLKNCKLTVNGSDCNCGPTSFNETVIESPYLSDIIFRKGSSLMAHAGNAALRTMVVAKARIELLEPKKPPTVKHFVLEIMKDIEETSRLNVASGSRKACRILVWNDGGWWNKLSSEKEIYTRMKHIVMGIRITVHKNHKRCSAYAEAIAGTKSKSVSTTKLKKTLASLSTSSSSSTSTSAGAAARCSINSLASASALAARLSLPRYAIKSPVVPGGTSQTMIANVNPPQDACLRDGIETYATAITTTATTGIGANTIAKRSFLPAHHQNGGTSIFLSQDCSGGREGIQQRRLQLAQDSSEDFVSETECFGMKFNSTNSISVGMSNHRCDRPDRFGFAFGLSI